MRAMKFQDLLLVVGVLILNGCSDDVPNVPPQDVKANKIVVAGERLSYRQFLDRYCVGKATHETCVQIRMAETAAMAKHDLPTKW